jgi:hypothetical protein
MKNKGRRERHIDDTPCAPFFSFDEIRLYTYSPVISCDAGVTSTGGCAGGTSAFFFFRIGADRFNIPTFSRYSGFSIITALAIFVNMYMNLSNSSKALSRSRVACCASPIFINQNQEKKSHHREEIFDGEPRNS